MVITDKFNNQTRIRLQPTRSASWRQTKWLITGLGGICLLVAALWSLAGAWLVLPFSSLEVGLLGWLAYRVCQDTYSQQMLLIDKQHIRVLWGNRYPKRQWQFDRRDCLFVITRPHHSLSTESLTLRGSEHCLPVGEKLNQQDMQTLLTLLHRLRLPCQIRGQVAVQALESEAD